jgi:hypothetical protein
VSRRSWFNADYDFGWRDVLVFSTFGALFLAFIPTEFCCYVAWGNVIVRAVASVLVSAIYAAMLTMAMIRFLFAK